jgi:hypothetical protein
MIKYNNLIAASIKTYEVFEKAMETDLFQYKIYHGIWSMPELANTFRGNDRLWFEFWQRWHKEKGRK